MADACRERIVAAVAALLVTAAAALATHPKVERNRREPLDDVDLPSLILFEGQELPLNDFSSEDAYRLSLLMQFALKGGGPAAAATAANNLRAAIMKALRADVSLGGLCRNLEIVDAGDWIGTATLSDDTEGFILQADITYATVEGDPFTFSN
jgi:hypothetical protein